MSLTECGSLFESLIFPGARRTGAGHIDASRACLLQALVLTASLPCSLGPYHLTYAPRFCPGFSWIWFPCALQLLARSSKSRKARCWLVATLRGILCGYSHRPTLLQFLPKEPAPGHISLFCFNQQQEAGFAGWGVGRADNRGQNYWL